MMNRNQPLTDLQRKVLEWVSKGSPDGVWEDTSYKRSAYSLTDRGLITVDRRRHSWTAQMTESGRYYLQHGQYRSLPESRRSGTAGKRKKQSPEATITPSDLIAEVQAVDGILTVPDPAPVLRAGYRRAISVALSDGLAPNGYALRHTGRDSGDLVIRLVPRNETTERRDELEPIPVPTSLEGAHSMVRTIRDERPELLDVEGTARERALLLLQAIAEECARRGYELRLRPDDTPTFRISAMNVDVDVRMYEEYERRSVVNEDELKEVKYAWQRVRSSVQKVRSGKLALSTGPSYSPVWWADRKRWSLAERLPLLFKYVQETVVETVERRERAEQDRKEQQRAWEEGKVRARELYVADFNRRRLDEQLERSRRSGELRRYASQIDQVALETTDSDLAQQAQKWADWTRAEAKSIDPLMNPAELVHVEPKEIADTALDDFMPRGMKASRPPQ